MSNQQVLLALQGTYNIMQVSLFIDEICVKTVTESETRASETLIPIIDELLKSKGLKLEDLSAIAIDNGPGAFTSLRVTVVTANAISFASHIPLIGINSLNALVYQTKLDCSDLISSSKATVVAALLNAYNHEVYVSYQPMDKFEVSLLQRPACLKIETLMSNIENDLKGQTILFTGNGSILHKELIVNIPGINALFEDEITEHCSSMSVAQMAFKKIRAGDPFVKKLSPEYMKSNMGTLPKKKISM
jgi:tRNA threonylcarbamoyladenosine biosynthesis protein TsaB